MSTPRDLPTHLPLFPLSGAILLPRSVLPLHIFEPRYLQMIEDALRTEDRLIGMIQPIDEGMAQIGAAGRIVSFTETDDGRMLISLRCRSRFRLVETQEGFAPYLRAQVDWSEFSADLRPDHSDDPDFDREAFLSRLGRFMAERELSTNWDTARATEEETLINSLSMLLPFDPKEKQALLESPDRATRRVLLDGLIEYALHSSTEQETLH